MDVPDEKSTASSPPDSRVSSAAGTLSSVSLLHTVNAPKTITDLPSEMILRIYRYLDSASEIIALNSTSRLYYWIWRMNAVSISSAVLSRSVECYNNVLELFELEERLKQIHCVVLSQCAVLKRLRIAQREAREVVQQGPRNDRWHHMKDVALYVAVLYRNYRLFSMARDASHVLDLIERKVAYSGGTIPNDFDRKVTPSRQNNLIAYHELAFLIRLKLSKAMEDRLETMCKRKLRQMLYVATYLVCYCPDEDKIRLGISRAITLRGTPWSWARYNMESDPRPRCRIITAAGLAFYAVADRLGDQRIPDHLFGNRSGCHGDCDETEIVEEDE